MAEKYPGQIATLRHMIAERTTTRAMAEARGWSPYLLDIFFDREIARYKTDIERASRPPASTDETPGTPMQTREIE
jgi:hypothetical protein